MCNVRFYSDEHVNDVDRRIKAWYENSQKIEKARHEAEWEKMYGEKYRNMWQNKPPGIPATSSVPGKGNIEGHCYLDDNDQWVYVFPD